MGTGQRVSAPASGPRSLPLGVADAAHRERDIPDAAHGVAVVSRVDSTSEDLMQMHVRSPDWPEECKRGSRSLAPGPPPAQEHSPLRLPQDPPGGASGLSPGPSFAFHPPLPSHRRSSTAAAQIAARRRKCPDAPTACCTGAQMREEGKGCV